MHLCRISLPFWSRGAELRRVSCGCGWAGGASQNIEQLRGLWAAHVSEADGWPE